MGVAFLETTRNLDGLLLVDTHGAAPLGRGSRPALSLSRSSTVKVLFAYYSLPMRRLARIFRRLGPFLAKRVLHKARAVGSPVAGSADALASALAHAAHVMTDTIDAVHKATSKVAHAFSRGANGAACGAVYASGHVLCYIFLVTD